MCCPKQILASYKEGMFRFDIWQNTNPGFLTSSSFKENEIYFMRKVLCESFFVIQTNLFRNDCD